MAYRQKHIIVKFMKTKTKEKNLKNSLEKKYIAFKVIINKLSADFNRNNKDIFR